MSCFLNQFIISYYLQEKRVSPPDLPDPKIHYQRLGTLLDLVNSGYRFAPITPQHIEQNILPSSAAQKEVSTWNSHQWLLTVSAQASLVHLLADSYVLTSRFILITSAACAPQQLKQTIFLLIKQLYSSIPRVSHCWITIAQDTAKPSLCPSSGCRIFPWMWIEVLVDIWLSNVYCRLLLRVELLVQKVHRVKLHHFLVSTSVSHHQT